MMNYQTIDDVYSANAAIREKLKQTIGSLTEDQLTARPDGEKWTVTELVEHISIVNEGLTRICAKLLSKAEAAGNLSDGKVTISKDFADKAEGSTHIKLEAPEIVHPTASVSIDDSFARMDSNHEAIEALREKFKKFDGIQAKFPHPYFGDLSAHEWLVLIGGHEGRHLRQIRKLVEKIG